MSNRRSPGGRGAPRSAGARRRQAERRRRVRTWLWGGGLAAAAAGVIAVVLVAAHGSATPSSAGGGTARVQLLSQGGADVGQTAPSFTALTVSGSTFRSPGGRPTVLYFMAGWCATCMPESRALGQVAQQRSGRVNILAVDADPTDPLSSLQNFIQQVGEPSYPFAQDESGKLVQAFNVSALDVTVVIDPAGRIVYRNTVPIDDATILSALATAGAA